VLTLRSLIFTALLFASAIFGAALELIFFWAPFRVKWGIATGWARFCLWAGKFFCGLNVTTEGTENIPDEPSVFLIKHTTAMEAYWQIAALPPSTWVLKRELLWVPVFGWALGFVMKSIAVDRGAGGSAVKQVLAQGKDRIASGKSVCIFPEGTRMAPAKLVATASAVLRWQEKLVARLFPSRTTLVTSGRAAVCAKCQATFVFVLARRSTRLAVLRKKPTRLRRNGLSPKCAR